MTLFPGMSTSDLLVRATSHYTPNYRQAPMVLTRGDGSWVWDRDGKRYLDLIAGIAVTSVGHGHPRLVNAIAKQAKSLIHCSNLWHNEPAIALMDQLTTHSFGDRVFFTNSGAESNEAAIKLARRYWSIVKGRPEKTELLSFNGSFHGRTMATVTATGQEKYQKGYAPLLPGVRYADFGDITSVEAAFAASEGCIGAVLIEPIQCEGGLRIPPASFLTKLREVCDSQEALLIFDEVQTGIGRCAEWFAYQHFGVTPDIMTLAKGIGGGVPLGAMVAKSHVAEAFVPSSHASTFGGNPLATRAGLEVMRIIGEEKLLERAKAVGNTLRKGIDALIKRHPDHCLESRGVGLLQGLELRTDDPELGAKVVAQGLQRGLLLNAIQGHILRFAPPLTIQKGEIKTALAIIDEILAGL